MASTKLLAPLLGIIVDRIMLLNYYVQKFWSLITICVCESIFFSAISMCLLKVITSKGKTTERLAHDLIINLFSSEYNNQYTWKNHWYFTPLDQIIPLILI